MLSPSDCYVPPGGLTSDVRESTVLVIGAGPAGLATSLALSKLCKKVILVEKHDDFLPRGASLAVMKNGQQAIKEICAPALQEIEKLGVLTPSGLGLLLPWFELRDILARHVVQKANIELHMGYEVSKIADFGASEGVSVASTDSAQPILFGNFAVACDGVHSIVREHLGLRPGIRGKSTSFRGIIRINEDNASSNLRDILENGGFMPLLIPQYDGFYFFSLSYHEKRKGLFTWYVSTNQPLQKSGETALEVCQRFIKDDEKSLALLKEILDLSNVESATMPFPSAMVMDFSDDYLELFNGGWGGKGCITLVGDAAHAMQPIDGQGGNQAFEDAVVLGRTLSKTSNLEHALREFEKTRLPRVKKIHDHQRLREIERMSSVGRVPMDEEMKDFIFRGV